MVFEGMLVKRVFFGKPRSVFVAGISMGVGRATLACNNEQKFGGSHSFGPPEISPPQPCLLTVPISYGGSFLSIQRKKVA